MKWVSTIPDTHIIEGMKRITMGAPKGMEDSVSPIECLRNDDPAEFWVLCENEGKQYWLIILGDIFPPVAFAPVVFDNVSSD